MILQREYRGIAKAINKAFDSKNDVMAQITNYLEKNDPEFNRVDFIDRCRREE